MVHVMSTASVLFATALACGCLPQDELPEARWDYLHAAIMQPSCATASCHSALTAIGGVDLSGAEGSYVILTGRICGEPLLPQQPPRNFVTPGSSEYSELIYQLRGADAEGRPYHNVMPRDGRLPEVEIELVARWIDEGARCD